MCSEILVVPKNGQGHLFPCMELCKQLVSRNYRITLVVDSDISSSMPTSLQRSPLFEIAHFSSSPPPTTAPGSGIFQLHQQRMHSSLETLLTRKSENTIAGPVCAVIDHIMYATQQVFAKFGIPTVTFITSGACWAAMQHAVWKAQPSDMKPGDIRSLSGLPEDIVLKYSDLKQRSHWMFPPPHAPVGVAPPHAPVSKRPRGPPFPGEPARWVAEVESSIAIFINTCDDLERPFLEYVAGLTGKPVWGVGPLLPEQYWRSADLLFQDREIRPKRDSSHSDDETIKWIDSKPRGSVLYVSFGSEVGPSMEEYPELASALEETKWSFIWVIQKKSGKPGPPGVGQPGPHGSDAVEDYFPHGLQSRVGDRGLIIHGWAPQLLILSHPSTGGFVTHCGWNSTVEAIVRGVPLLAWPIRGDQYYNAKLVVSHLKIGTMISEGYPEDMVTKADLMHGIEMVLSNEDIKNQTATVRASFEQGFPASSAASLDAFTDFITQKFA